MFNVGVRLYVRRDQSTINALLLLVKTASQSDASCCRVVRCAVFALVLSAVCSMRRVSYFASSCRSTSSDRPLCPLHILCAYSHRWSRQRRMWGILASANRETGCSCDAFTFQGSCSPGPPAYLGTVGWTKGGFWDLHPLQS